MAQLAEQLICNQQVIGSSPIIGFYTISYCIYGQIPEWPKGTDCKSAANCFGGSNPPLPIKMTLRGHLFIFNFISRDGAVWKLAGLITRRSQVQILSPQLHIAPGQRPDPERFYIFYAQLAQLVEQGTENPRVSGSIPELGTQV